MEEPSNTYAGIVLSLPLENTGMSHPNLMTNVAGNLYELQSLSGLRLIGLDLSDAFAAENPGPQFSVAGMRDMVTSTTARSLGR